MLKTKELVVECTDSLRMEEFQINESAINVMAAMLGKNTREIILEEDKEAPDIEKIKLLEEDGYRLRKEQETVYFSDDIERKRELIERYTPIIRELLENA